MVDQVASVQDAHSCYIAFENTVTRVESYYTELLALLDNGGVPTTYNAVLTSIPNYGQYVGVVKSFL